MTKVSARQYEIIEAAGKILTEAGVKGLTIKNLAKEMHFSESAIYRHFTSKEKIIIGMLDYLSENMNERFAIAVLDNSNPKDQFRALFLSQFHFFNSNPHFVAAVFSDGLFEESKNINLAIFRIMEVKTKHLLPVLKSGVKSGDFTNQIPLDDLTHIVTGTFRLQMFKWRVNNFNFNLIDKGKQTIESILKVIK